MNIIRFGIKSKSLTSLQLESFTTKKFWYRIPQYRKFMLSELNRVLKNSNIEELHNDLDLRSIFLTKRSGMPLIAKNHYTDVCQVLKLIKLAAL